MKTQWSSEEIRDAAERYQDWCVADLIDLSRYNASGDVSTRLDKAMATQAFTLLQTVQGKCPVWSSAEWDEPASWWQMFKRDWFPTWLLGLFPVRNTRVRGSALARLIHCSPAEWEEFRKEGNES